MRVGAGSAANEEGGLHLAKPQGRGLPHIHLHDAVAAGPTAAPGSAAHQCESVPNSARPGARACGELRAVAADMSKYISMAPGLPTSAATIPSAPTGAVTTTGSPAYQSELIKDAMAVVVQKGPPTYFITMTANAKWPEIEALTTPQCALCKAACAGLRGIRRGCMQCKRPQTVIARVFKQKMHKMLDIVKQWEGGLEYYFLVVEFQNRGLPHCHLALRCKDSSSLEQTNAPLNPDAVEVTDSRLRGWRPHIQTEMPRDEFEWEPRHGGPNLSALHGARHDQ